MLTGSESITASNLTRGLTESQIQEFLKTGTRKQVRAKSILFRQDDPADRCFFIESGRLKLTKLDEDGDEAIIRYIGPGELTAAVVVLKGKNYPVTAEAVLATNVIGWGKRTLDNMMQQYPELAINILHIVLKRIDDLQDRYFELSTKQVEQRLARSLLRIMQHAGKETVEGIHIDFPLNRQDLAEYAGTTLFTASRMLSSWEKRGWIKSKRGKIIVTDPHALVLFSEGRKTGRS